jgi:DNA-binding XRE family transcriptional regulator
MLKKLHKLQYLRKKAGFSQEDMASKVDLTVHGYRKLEQGQRRMTMDIALMIKKILGVEHVEDMLDDAL